MCYFERYTLTRNDTIMQCGKCTARYKAKTNQDKYTCPECGESEMQVSGITKPEDIKE